jgi:hypothetical protein
LGISPRPSSEGKVALTTLRRLIRPRRMHARCESRLKDTHRLSFSEYDGLTTLPRFAYRMSWRKQASCARKPLVNVPLLPSEHSQRRKCPHQPGGPGVLDNSMRSLPFIWLGHDAAHSVHALHLLNGPSDLQSHVPSAASGLRSMTVCTNRHQIRLLGYSARQ